ncbi:MAG: ATP-binding protein [Clostridia bacterium]|nr:ATP-binding protein [Clostridia bacterium]
MLTIMCGLPGSGKSTYARELPGRYVSTDEIREFVTGDARNIYHDDLVFTMAREMVKQFLKGGEDVVYDATNLTRADRKKAAKWAGDRPVRVVWVDCPLELALERNRERERQVPEEVIRRMAKRFQIPNEEEGYEIINIKAE